MTASDDALDGTPEAGNGGGLTGAERALAGGSPGFEWFSPTAVERIIAAREAAAKAEVLREAADAIDADDEVALDHILGGASYTTYWLRERADRIEAGVLGGTQGGYDE